MAGRRNIITRLGEIRSAGELKKRVIDFFILLGKVAAGRYGERYWEREKRAGIIRYEKEKESIVDAQVHLRMGRLYGEKGERNKAQESFGRALELDTEGDKARLEYVRYYKDMGKYDEAVRLLGRVAACGKQKVEAIMELGEIDLLKGEYDRAEKQFERALEYGAYGRAFFGLGRIYRKKREYGKALLMFRKAVEAGSGNEETYEELFSAEYERLARELEETGKLERKTPAGAPPRREPGGKSTSRVEKSIRLGREFRKQGRREEALEQFARANESADYGKNPFFANRILNEIEMMQGKSILESKPRTMTVTLTTRCNLKCGICGLWRNDPWDLPEKAFSEIERYFPYFEKVIWQGGEVFLSGHFPKIFEKAPLYPQLHHIIITNGLLIDRDKAELLCRDGVHVTLKYSIDGFGASSYEALRQGGKMEELLSGIRLINETRHRYAGSSRPSLLTDINFVVTKSNYAELEKAADFALEHGFDSINLIPLMNETGMEDFFFDGSREIQTIENRTLLELEKRATEKGIAVYSHLPVGPRFMGVVPVHDFRKPAAASPPEERKKIHFRAPGEINLDERRHGCWLPWQQLFIMAGGQMRVDCLCGKKIGDISVNTIEEVWNNEMMREYRRRMLLEEYNVLCDERCPLFRRIKSGRS